MTRDQTTTRARRLGGLGLWLGFTLWMAAGGAVVQAQNPPRVGYAYPAGGRQGSSFQAAIGGQFLSGATNIYVSGAGVQGAVLEWTRPLSPQEFNKLREEAKSLQDRKTRAMQQLRKSGSKAVLSTNWTAADETLLAELRVKLQKLAPRRGMNPAIAETLTVRLTIAPDAELGERDLRVGTLGGISNPVRFWIDAMSEFTQPEARLTVSARPQGRSNALAPAKPSDTKVSLPMIVNGQILAGGIDRYRFQARRGQRLVAAVKARELAPYLADAVPGWFQVLITLYDADGRELAYADHDRFRPDPVLRCEIPRDGEYALEVRDSLYRGREDFVYRLAIGELPFVSAVFPLGGSVDAGTDVRLNGWNLPVESVTFDGRGKAPGVYPLTLPPARLPWNAIDFAIDALPETTEAEPNDTPEAAQSVDLPVIVNGRIDRSGDVDVFRFQGRARQEIVAEVYARRLGSPLDSVVELTDVGGAVLAANDDYEDRSMGLETHHADSWLRTALPTDGVYFLRVRDAQRHGGVEYGYRVRLGPPQPGFALRVVPSSINVRAGASAPVTVYALRTDGFTNAIALALKDAPPGIRLGGGVIPAGQDQARLTLSAGPLVVAEPFRLSLEGRADIQGRTVTQPALPADDMMQAFAYHQLVVAKEQRMAVTRRVLPLGDVKVLSAAPLRIPAGGTTRLRLGLPGSRAAERLRFELSDPPAGILLESTAIVDRGVELVISGDDDVVTPGTKGNLIVDILPAANSRPGQPAARPGAKRRVLGSLPAIPFEIVAE